MEPTIYKPSIYKGAGIYKAGAEGGGGGGIPIIDPSLYKQLSYIEINGNSNPSFANVFRYKTTDKLKISCDVKPIDFNDNRQFVVAYFDGFTQYYFYHQSPNKAFFHYDFNGYPIVGDIYINVSLSNWFNLSWEIKENTGYFSLNDSKRTINDTNVTRERNLSIFDNARFYDFIGTKFFRCTVYDGETDNIKLDYVPCLRISDNKLGIYEIYGQTFITPSTNNSYNAGPAV